MISDAVGISIGTVETVLTEDLKLHKVCAQFVPKIPLQRHAKVNIGEHLDG